MKPFIFLLILFCSIRTNAQSRVPWDSLYGNRAEEKELVVQSDFEAGKSEVTASLDSFLDSLAQRDLKAPRISGYRILLYSGNERDGATNARENAYRIFQKADLYTTYNAPTFKVRLGNFYQRLDAYRALKKLEAYFPHAVIVQEVVILKP